MRSDTQTALAEARRLFDAGRLEAAASQLRNVLNDEPKSVDAHVMMGVIAAQKQQYPEAGKHLTTALEAEPDRYDALTWLAMVRHAEGDMPAAADLLTRALALQPGDPTAITLLGVCRLAMGEAKAAEQAFRGALRLQPRAPQAHYNLGMALRLQNRVSDSLACFQEALRLDPAQPQNYVQVFRQLQQLSRWDEAIECLEKGLRRLPQSAVLGEALGVAYGRAGQTEKAERVFRRFSDSDPQVAQSYAEWLQQEGRFADSVAVLEASIRERPLQGPAYRGLAEARVFRVGEDSLIDRIEEIFDRPEIDDRARMHLAYALGRAFEAQGRYEEAIHSFDTANKLAYRLYPASHTFDVAATESDPDIMAQVYTSDLLRRMTPLGSTSDRPIFIVGMIRSGTTLLDQILSSHPSVSSGGEIPFWNAEADAVHRAWRENPEPADAARLADAYLRILQSHDALAQRVTDKMPLNFRHLGLIQSALPNAKILHIRRHPIDTCLSIYTTFFAGGPTFTYNKPNIVAYYRAYLRHMEHWRRVLPVESLHELDYEQLIARPEETIRAALEFCGPAWDPACLRHQDNRSAVATPSRWQARQPIYTSSVERWRKYEPWLGVFAQLREGEPPASTNEPRE